MPIVVHCPNPACARVHNVKDKYAGMRGKCPACQSWMYIPRAERAARPAVAQPRAAKAAPVPRTAPLRKPVVVPQQRAPVPALALPDEPALRPNEPRYEPPAIEPEDSAVAAASADETAEAPAPKKHFSWLAVFLLLLANVGLGAFAAAPYLPGPDLQATGDFAHLAGSSGISADGLPFVLGAAGVVGLFGVLAMLIALFSRRFGFFSRLLVYLAVIGSAALLLLSLEWFLREAGPDGNVAKLQRAVQLRQEKGERGEATAALGLQHFALGGGAAAASLFFVLAGVLMHRRLWAKLLAFGFLAFWPALAVAWVFRQTLGIDGDSIPFQLPRL